jgi:hypothetical protein
MNFKLLLVDYHRKEGWRLVLNHKAFKEYRINTNDKVILENVHFVRA